MKFGFTDVIIFNVKSAFEYFENKVVLNDDFSMEDFEKLTKVVNGDHLDFIVLKKKQVLDEEFMANVYFRFPGTMLFVAKTKYNGMFEDTISQHEIGKFVRIVNHSASYGCPIRFVDMDDDFAAYLPSQVVSASLKVNKMVEKIKNSKANNCKLSQFEKYMYAYEFVTSHETDLKDGKKSFFAGLINGKLNQTASSELLNELCKKLNIPSMLVKMYIPKPEVQNLSDTDSSQYSESDVCFVHIKDNVYGIDGIYVAIPSLDMGFVDGKPTINHALLTYQDFTNLLGYQFYFKFNKLDLMMLNEFLSSIGKTDKIADVRLDSKESLKIMQAVTAGICLDVSPFLLDKKDIENENIVDEFAKIAEEFLNVKQVPRMVDETKFSKFVQEQFTYYQIQNELLQQNGFKKIHMGDDFQFVLNMLKEFYSNYNIDFEKFAELVLKEKSNFQLPKEMVLQHETFFENSALMQDFKLFEEIQKKVSQIELNDYCGALTNIAKSKGLITSVATKQAIETINKSREKAKDWWVRDVLSNPFLGEKQKTTQRPSEKKYLS